MDDRHNGEPFASNREAAACAAANAMASVHAALAGAPHHDMEGVNAARMNALYAFGVRGDWPPAEAFCRQFCSLHGVRFDAERWNTDAALRASWAVFRAAAQALHPIDLGFDPKMPEPAVRQARPDADDDAFETQSGAFDREPIPGPRVKDKGLADVTTVKGVGKKLGERLKAQDIRTVRHLATADLDALADADASLAAMIKTRGLVEAASAQLG